MEEYIFGLLGKAIIFGGGGIAIGYGLFKWLGGKWIENKFAQQLKKMEFKQQESLARLRVEVESMLGGALKLQERDFSVLPITWDALHNSYSAVEWFVSPLQITVNVEAMNENELNEFLSKQEWSDSQKEKIRNAINPRERTKQYELINFMYQSNKVRTEFYEYKKIVSKYSIFYHDPLKEKLDQLIQLLWQSIVSRESGYRHPTLEFTTRSLEIFDNQTAPLKVEIEKIIRDRLKSHSLAKE